MIFKIKRFSKLSKLINNTKLVNRTRSKIMSTAKRMNNPKLSTSGPQFEKHLGNKEYEKMLEKYGTPSNPNNSESSMRELKAIGRADRQHEYLSKIYKNTDINSKISRKIKEPLNQKVRYKNVTDAYSQARTNVNKELRASRKTAKISKSKRPEEVISENNLILSSSRSPSKRKYDVPKVSESVLSPNGKISEKIHQQVPTGRAPKQLYNKYIAKNTEDKFATRINKGKDNKWWRGKEFYQNHTERHVHSTNYK